MTDDTRQMAVDANSFVTGWHTVTPALQINNAANGRPVLKFNRDGTIEIGEGYTPQDASDRFIEILRSDFALLAARSRFCVGDKVVVIGTYADDWLDLDLWITAIRTRDSGNGADLDYTLGMQWPVPHRHKRGYLDQTDGFSAHDLMIAPHKDNSHD